VRAIPEEVRVRRSVGEGIGRFARELYSEQRFEAFPDWITAMLARLDLGMAPGARFVNRAHESGSPTRWKKERLS
jgi:hypothetical protein